MSKNNRTLIKLDDKLLEVTQGKKGFQIKELSDNDLLEVSLLDEGVEKFIENDVNRLTNEAYDELKKSFKETLKSNVLKVIGFEYRWNQWDVDHCNGRMSQLTTYMSEKVKNMITAELDKLLQVDVEQLMKPVRQTLVKDFQEAFEREARNRIREQAAASAADFVKDIMDKQMQKFQRAAIQKAKTAFLGGQVRQTDEDEPEDEY